MKKINVYGIVWDDVPQGSLPSNVTIEVPDNEYEMYAKDPALIADKISDMYGYCIESYETDDADLDDAEE